MRLASGRRPSGGTAWTKVGLGFTFLVTVLGGINDGTTLVQNDKLRAGIRAVFPYLSAVLAVGMAVAVLVLIQRNRRLQTTANQIEARHQRILHRLVRVLGGSNRIAAVSEVPSGAIDPLFDELVAALPAEFRVHQKFSVARPNPNGTFTLMATRGMDPAAVRSVEAQASWIHGRSFYANLLNDNQRRSYRLFTTGDTGYVDSRTVGDTASRPSSSSSHFLVALRDDDLYDLLPGKTLGIVSIGVPKGLEFDEAGQADLYARVLPVAKAVEVLLLTATLREGYSLSAAPGVEHHEIETASGKAHHDGE